MTKNILLSFGSLAMALAIYTGCTSSPSKSDSSTPRSPAQSASGAPVTPASVTTAAAEKTYLAYYQKNPETGVESVQVFNPEKWHAIRPGHRYDLLTQMYFANTRAMSHSKLIHQACFTGDADTVLEKFFSGIRIANRTTSVENLGGYPSTDGLMLGVQFRADGKEWHFRLTSCRASGKGPFFSEKLLEEQIAALEGNARAPNAIAERESEGAQLKKDTVETTDGFADNDKATGAAAAKLPKFKLRADYDKATPTDTPWLEGNLNVANAEEAEKFALILQKYVYEGMANQDLKNPDRNFITQNNSQRYWCHMPWLNQGESGREAIHGLTKERDLAPSTIWPAPPKGADWGVGMFNSIGCKTIHQQFGTKEKPIPNPRVANLNVEDGTVIFKILFTTADFPEIKNAFTWHANVNGPGQTVRSIQTVRHIQMDIAVKDSRIKGLASDAAGFIGDGWMMLTYYYDETYTSPLAESMNLPEGFKHMRPMGVQSGFTPADSLIFKDAKTNQVAGQLNGPADNPKSSCLGCHASAGTSFPMSPGLMSTLQWRQLKEKEGALALDFGQQFALARRNCETRPK